jgi:hypothetical protein
MPDDKPRRPGTHRDIIGRGRSPLGVPVAIDEEATPPPQEPPRAPGAALHVRIDRVEEHLGSVTTALGRLWDARDIGPKLETMSADLRGYTHDLVELGAQMRDFVMPAIKSHTARIEAAASYIDRERGRSDQFWDSEWPRMIKVIEKLDARFDDLGERLTRLERQADTLNHNIGGQGARLASVEAVGNAHDVRLTALERRFADADAGDKRQAKLLSMGRAGLLVLVAIVSAVAANLPAIASWLRG